MDIDLFVIPIGLYCISFLSNNASSSLFLRHGNKFLDKALICSNKKNILLIEYYKNYAINLLKNGEIIS